MPSSRGSISRARIVAALGDASRDRTDLLLMLGAALLSDAVLVDTSDQAAKLRGQLAGRTVLVLPPEVAGDAITSVLAEAGIPVARPSVAVKESLLPRS
jgi:hypothetical protein